MQVMVRYFAMLREQRGRGEEELHVEAGTSVGMLYQSLFPPSSRGSMPVMYAINQVYVKSSQVLEAGDEIAFIPPLGGG